MQPQAPQADWLQGVITVEQEGADARRDFIRKTYVHFLMGLMAFCGLVWGAMSTPAIIEPMFAVPWFVWLIAMMGLSFAYRFFFASANMTTHYIGFGLTIVLQAAFTAPLFYIINLMPTGPTILRDAFMLTALGFGGLTAFTLLSKKDFSFLGGMLWTATLILIGVMVISLFMGGGGMGLWLSAAVLILFAGWVLYDTSMIQHHLPLNGYVFGATMIFIDFVVILRQVAIILMSMASDD